MSEERPTYYEVLAEAHHRIRPRGYLEIGVHEGHSLQLAAADTACVGIDPEPHLHFETHATVHAMTSDAYFAARAPGDDLGAPLDLAFVDGLHLFEQALTDVANIEAHAHPGTVILIHDCLPIDRVTAARERTTVVWSGDVWKVMVALGRHRPDLSLTVLDAQPTGIGVVTGADAASTILRDRFDDIVGELIDRDYDEALRELLPVEPVDDAVLTRLFGDAGS